MDDVGLGATIRAVRIRKRLTQATVARAAHVHQWDVSRLEAGRVGDLRLATLRGIAAALGMRLEIKPQWRGPELDRLVNAAHAALQGSVLRRFEVLDGWAAVPEASYSIYGERGAIDILAWHAASRTLLIVELKTVLVEAAGLVRTMDQRLRLGPEIGRQRGWRPRDVCGWVIFTDTSTNRRHVAVHREVLAPIAAADGRRMRTWLRAPDGRIAALSFWDEPSAVITRRVGRRRVGSRPARIGAASDGAAV